VGRPIISSPLDPFLSSGHSPRTEAPPTLPLPSCPTLFLPAPLEIYLPRRGPGFAFVVIRWGSVTLDVAPCLFDPFPPPRYAFPKKIRPRCGTTAKASFVFRCPPQIFPLVFTIWSLQKKFFPEPRPTGTFLCGRLLCRPRVPTFLPSPRWVLFLLNLFPGERKENPDLHASRLVMPSAFVQLLQVPFTAEGPALCVKFRLGLPSHSFSFVLPVLVSGFPSRCASAALLFP